jgi:hypothetical protein
MNSEIKEALLRFRQREQLALEDSLAARLAMRMNELSAELRVQFLAKDEARRAESARHDAVLAHKLAIIAAQAEHETAVSDAYKKGFTDAWNLSR